MPTTTPITRVAPLPHNHQSSLIRRSPVFGYANKLGSFQTIESWINGPSEYKQKLSLTKIPICKFIVSRATTVRLSYSSRPSKIFPSCYKNYKHESYYSNKCIARCTSRNAEIWEANPTLDEYPYVQAAQGIVVLLFAERGLSTVVSRVGLPLPSPVLLLGIIAAFMATNSSASLKVYNWAKPAVLVFDTWMPLFFAPSVAGIVLAPLPVGAELAKGTIILGGTYFLTLWASALLGSQFHPNSSTASITIEPDSTSDREKMERIGNTAKLWTRRAIGKGAKYFASAALSSSTPNDFQTAAVSAAHALDQLSQSIPVPVISLPSPPSNAPLFLLQAAAALLLPIILLMPQARADHVLMSPGLLLLTVGFFLASKKMPPPFKPWITPTVASGSIIALITALYGSLVFNSWKAGVLIYSSGAGKLLAMMIAPAVAALGFKVHTERETLKKSMKQLVFVSVIMAPSCLIFGALIGRIIGASPTLTLSLIPSTTTLGLAREMIPLIGSVPGLVVAGVTIAGTIGMVSGRQTLDFFKVNGSMTRGSSIGAAAHTLGASGLVSEEPQAAAVAGLSLALKGALSVVFLTFPPFRNFILFLAGKV